MSSQVDVSALSFEDRSELELGLLQRVGARKRADRIERAPIGGALPLSAAERRLWFTQSLNPSSAAYNVVSAMRISGPLRLAALEEAFGDIVDRHETLRTTYPIARGVPYVARSEHVGSVLSLVCAEGAIGPDRESNALRQLIQLANTPFNLSDGPIIRARLIEIDPLDHLLGIAIHHIACDEWSMRNLHEELREAYTARTAGRVPVLAELPIQYADFSVWQRNQLENGAFSEARRYWLKVLADAPEQFTIPYDDKVIGEPLAGRYSVSINKELTGRLDQIARRAGATPFTIMLSAFVALLHGRTGASDALVGTPVAARSRAELEPLIGCVSNTLLIRTSASAETVFSDFLSQVRTHVTSAIAHQDFPFDEMVRAINPTRDEDGLSLFRVLFTHRDAIRQPFDTPLLKSVKIDLPREAAKCDLWLSVIDEGGQRSASFVYATDRFRESTIAVLAEAYLSFLEAVAEAPDIALGALWSKLDFAGGQARSARPPKVITAVGDPSSARKSNVTATRMLELWRSVLQRSDLDFDGNFFDCGGHSLLALRLLAEIDEQFGHSLPLSLLFEAPTAREFAHRVDELRTRAQPVIAADFIFPVIGEGRPFFYCSLGSRLVRPGRWNVPCQLYSVSNWAKGKGLIEARSVEELASYQVANIRRIQPAGPYLLGGFCHGALIAYEMAQQLKQAGEEVDLLLLLDPMRLTPRRVGDRGAPDPFQVRVLRRLRIIAEGPRQHGWAAWLSFLIPYRVPNRISRIIHWVLVKRYLQRMDASSRLLSRGSMFEAFWYEMEHVFRSYKPTSYDGSVLAVFSSDGRSEGWGELCRGSYEERSLRFTHADMFEEQAIDEWTGLLLASLGPTVAYGRNR